jgi:hypothetical protein
MLFLPANMILSPADMPRRADDPILSGLIIITEARP